MPSTPSGEHRLWNDGIGGSILARYQYRGEFRELSGLQNLDISDRYRSPLPYRKKKKPTKITQV